MLFQDTVPTINSAEVVILIVDDDQITAQLIQEGVKDLGQTYHVNCGEAALTFCQEQVPDIILMDVNMPSMSGTDVITKLNSDDHTQDIPVIFITGDHSIDTENLCWELGAADFINKPMSTRTLFHRVKSQLDHKFMVDRLRRQATTDGLTGVQNRRFFDEYLTRQINLCARSRKPISLLLLDIDFFKAYNDNFGHQLGDECLKNLAQTLIQTVVRESDCVARYGGEEFAVVLPMTSNEEAKIAAERIRKAVVDLDIPNPTRHSEKLTISIGGATSEETYLTPKEMIKRADKKLYEAKKKGRDQAVL